MKFEINRRDFLATGAALAAGGMFYGLGSNGTLQAESIAETAKYKTQLFKSWIGGLPDEKSVENLKTFGYAGVESQAWQNVTIESARNARRIAESFDFRIQSVMRGWAEFNNKDEATARKSIEDTKHAIRVAAAYGADTILLVPCRTGGTMPAPWDFKYDFDPKTLKVKSVLEGDNARYADYINVHNYSTEASIKAIEELIPLAAKEGVVIAIENVWNNLWVMPDIFAAFVKYFDNHWVKAYLDLGNHTRYADPVYWIKALGNEIVKLHIKGYRIDEVKNELGGGEGGWCAIDKATIDWKTVRKTLDEVNYNGWIAVEEGNHPLEKYSEILDDFINS